MRDIIEFRVRLEGSEELQRLLILLPDVMSNAIDAGLDDIGKKGEKYAKALCPIRTGELHDSIGYGVGNNVVYLYASAPHARYVEFGTGRRGREAFVPMGIDIRPTFSPNWAGMYPKPFLRPAMMLMARMTKRSVGSRIMKAIRGAAAKIRGWFRSV